MKKILLKSTFLVYLLIGLEIFIMISPFAAYFYSFYSPIIDYLYASRYTNWITEFFLPHFVFFKDPFMQVLGVIQLLTFFSGISLFLYAAVPLYWAKFRRQGVVTKGIYCKIRHPQYLGLGIAGFGLLLYWPRFLILILYVSMLFVYYLLARNEEQRMIKQYGRAYEDYMNTVPMFLPKNIGGRVYTSILGKIKSKAFGILILYFSVLCISALLAFALRSFSIDKIPLITMNGLSVISVLPEQKVDVSQIFDVFKKDDRLKNLMTDKRPNLAYIMPSDFFLMAIVTDMERLYPIEFERPRGGNTLIRFIKIFLNYTKMQVGIYENNHGLRRIIFISVKNRDGKVLEGKSIFLPGSRRFPLFLIDFDMDKKEIISIRELKPRHKWGDTPMPIF